MRMIPSNVMGNLLGLGYDVDSTNYYTSTALDYKCVGYWRLNETTAYNGTNFEVKNQSPFGVDGIMSTAGATHDTANGHVEFDGSTGFINMGNNYNFSWDEPLSIGLTLRVRTTIVANQIIAGKITTNSSWNGWMLWQNDRSIYLTGRGTSHSGNQQYWQCWATTFSTGLHNIMITYGGGGDTSLMEFWVDGATVAKGATVVTNSSHTHDSMANTNNMLIGKSPPFQGSDGIVSNFAIWNRYMADNDATNFYNGGTEPAINFLNHVPDVAYMAHIIKMELATDKYYTNADINIVYNDGSGNQTYLSRGFEVPVVEYSASPQVDSITVEFDNVDLEFSQLVLGQEVRGKTIKIWIAAMNGVPQVVGKALQFQGIIDSIEITRDRAIFNILSHMYLWQKKIPKRRHSSRCNWTFKDSVTCQYAGIDTVCDKSWEDCTVKANTVNFGGFRWLPSLIDQRIWWGQADPPPQNNIIRTSFNK